MDTNIRVTDNPTMHIVWYAIRTIDIRVNKNNNNKNPTMYAIRIIDTNIRVTNNPTIPGMPFVS